ncbi:unnamed protein product [Clonostachys rosea]|uniref:Uncharacterized protein n=1 Tax=Bionectria ochroleuca TaxID=29856 RepID=A0ABY6U4M2_BIOOC|nr:unnamed protein product [Clonostachys rosea]
MENRNVSPDSPEQFAKFTHFLLRQFSNVRPLAKEDINLSGRTFIVTGANAGIGFEVSKQLLDLGLSKLIIACRNETKAVTAKTLLLATRGEDIEIETWSLDLLSYNSITAFADRCKTLDRLDAAILNAGVSNEVLVKTPDTGIEEMFQVNYISITLLCLLLLPVLQAKGSPENPGRLVMVTSDMAAWVKPPLNEEQPIMPQFKNPIKFDRPTQYSVSKLFGQLFISELARQVPSASAIIRIANPGLCRATGMAADSQTFSGHTLFYLTRMLGKDPSVGAISLISAATVDWGLEAHDKLIDCNKLAPLAPIVYTKEGRKLANDLWEETLDELSFASVRDIITALEK